MSLSAKESRKYLALIVVLLVLLTRPERRIVGLYYTNSNNRDTTKNGNNWNRYKKRTNRPRLCARQEIRSGSWIPAASAIGPLYNTTLLGNTWFQTCDLRDQQNHRPYQSYQWKPEGDCQFMLWDAVAFCQALENFGHTTTISFLGDSTTHQQYSSLSMLLNQTSLSGEQRISTRQHTNIVKTVCDSKATLAFRRNDDLSDLDIMIQTTQPHILVINTGIHYRDDEALRETLHGTLRVLKEWQASPTCCEAPGQCLVLMRTTMPVHPYCMNFTSPINNAHAMEALVAQSEFMEGKEQRYHWWNVKGQNEFQEPYYEASKLNYDVLDGYDINLLRPDRHQSSLDCLHYCLPGPPDVLNQLLLHTLQSHILSIEPQ